MAQAFSSARPHSFIPRMTTGRTFGVVGVIYIVLLSAAALYQAGPPREVSAGAGAEVFSSGRAMKQLEEIGRSPHPLGSSEHARVREYIVRELSSVGLEPEVQSAVAVNAKNSQTLRAATVHNVITRLKGTGGREAVLLVAHYDTVPNSPGAGDDGSAVATLLETLRALKSSPALKNDVIVLFTDGEEVGSLGAMAFVEEHPYVRDVRVVLNFEARGSDGPVFMFETSSQNNWLIEEFAKAAPYPRANSLAGEIYRLLPNDTDLTVFKDAGLPGLNFANIDGVMRYHTRADNLSNVDERSLQHRGSYALALSRHFGNLDFPKQSAGDAVYSDVLGLVFVSYSAKWVLPLVVLAAALFVAVVALGWRRGRLTIAGVALGVVAFVLTVVSAAAIAGFLWWSISSAQRWAGRGLQDDFYQGKLYFAGLSIICVATAIALYQWFQRKTSLEELTVGAQGCCLVLLVAAGLFLQGGSYLLAWPLMFSSVALGLVFMMRREPKTSFSRFLVLALCVAPGILLLVPISYSVFVAVGLGMVWAVAALVGISLGLLVPHFGLMAGLGRLRVPAMVALIGVGLLLLAGLAFNFDGRHPRTNNVFYVLNADTGQAIWGSTERAADEWTGQFFGDGTERGSITEYMPLYGGAFLKHAAQAIDRQPTQVRVLDDSSNDSGVRTLRMNIEPSQPGAGVWVMADAKAEVLSAAINGKRVDIRDQRPNGQPKTPWTLQYWATPAGGIELTLEVKSAQPMTMLFVERSEGLPQVPGLTVRPRPDYLIPSSFAASDATLVRKTYTF